MPFHYFCGTISPPAPRFLPSSASTLLSHTHFTVPVYTPPSLLQSYTSLNTSRYASSRRRAPQAHSATGHYPRSPPLTTSSPSSSMPDIPLPSYSFHLSHFVNLPAHAEIVCFVCSSKRCRCLRPPLTSSCFRTDAMNTESINHTHYYTLSRRLHPHRFPFLPNCRSHQRGQPWGPVRGFCYNNYVVCSCRISSLCLLCFLVYCLR